jgi:replication factor A2
VTDFNELTHHLLEVIFVHLHNTKGPAVCTSRILKLIDAVLLQRGNSYLPSATSGFSANQYTNPYAAPSSTSSNLSAMNMEDLHGAVLVTIRSHQASHPVGVSVEFVCQQLGRDLSEIRPALDYLTENGHVYTTHDEGKLSDCHKTVLLTKIVSDHYRTTDAA